MSHYIPGFLNLKKKQIDVSLKNNEKKMKEQPPQNKYVQLSCYGIHTMANGGTESNICYIYTPQKFLLF